MSQTDIVREYLFAHPGERVPMTRLAEAMGGFAVHSRIAQLRRESGMIIINHLERAKDGKTHSFYEYRPHSNN
jgi:hypothetical protein